ncbi:winged helix-turn-helix domain-containing protein [Nocardioides sp. NPDC047086]|uniref:winged helix-turn-helix domain-containing protein n=1 Tax=Nocardioides sp. NPDC047086 TaxID=3154810 RepID=UPI00340DDDD0
MGEPDDLPMPTVVSGRSVIDAANTCVVLDQVNGPLVLDIDGVVLRRGDDVVPITVTEFLLLRELITHPEKALKRVHLLRAASPDGRQHLRAKNLPPHIRRIRTKIEADPDNPVIIKTVRGLGYRFDPQG